MRNLLIRFVCLALCLCLTLGLGAAAYAAEAEPAADVGAEAAPAESIPGTETEKISALEAALAGALCVRAVPASVGAAETLAVTVTLAGEAAPESGIWPCRWRIFRNMTASGSTKSWTACGPSAWKTTR